MSEMRLRPKDDFLHTAYWQDVHVLTEHWQSDMEFFRDELKFLRNLVDKYFIWMTMEENLPMVQEAARQVLQLSKKREEISLLIQKHMKDLRLLMEGEEDPEGKEFREDHSRLEDEIATFTKEFRKTKKQVFEVSEKVLESEKLQHLLTQ